MCRSEEMLRVTEDQLAEKVLPSKSRDLSSDPSTYTKTGCGDMSLQLRCCVEAEAGFPELWVQGQTLPQMK